MKPTLALGVALIVHMQSTACPGFVFPSCSTWLERTIPSAPESSNWQSRKKIHLAVKCNMILILNLMYKEIVIVILDLE